MKIEQHNHSNPPNWEFNPLLHSMSLTQSCKSSCNEQIVALYD
jgi:hypothetical protein